MTFPHLHPSERETLNQFLDEHRAMVLGALDALGGVEGGGADGGKADRGRGGGEGNGREGNGREGNDREGDGREGVGRGDVRGVGDSLAGERLLPDTGMTIGGIVKHLAQMEDLWFTHTLLGAAMPEPWAAVGTEESWAWESAGDDSVGSLRALYVAACARSRVAVAGFGDLGGRAALPSFGKAPVSLRWMLVQMIRETAQHCGHLDLMLDVVRRRA